MDYELGLFGLILLITCSIAAGVVAGVVHTWSLRARTFSLEDRLSIVEGTLTREVKTRAGQERWKKPSKDEELIKELTQKVAAQRAQPQQPWWIRPDLQREYKPGG